MNSTYINVQKKKKTQRREIVKKKKKNNKTKPTMFTSERTGRPQNDNGFEK